MNIGSFACTAVLSHIYLFPPHSFLQLQNDELRRRLAYATTKMEAMEHELDAGRHYLEVELSRNREELEKLKDKFRR